MITKEFNLKSFVIATLRRASYRSPNRTAALKSARVIRGTYQCAACKGLFGRREIAVDHIYPIVPVTGWDTWEGFMQRLFLGKLQCLCKSCHGIKTKEENRQRREYAKKALPKRAA